jgi:hypothetical protein
MLEILSDLSRVMRKHGIHWVLSQGEQLSVARDGYLQLWDHDVDPVFTSGRKADAVRIIAEEMHLSGPYAKWREADYYYNKRVAERQQTNWSKYTVHGGDFSWHNPNADSPYILQRNPTFMDIGQATVPKPTRETTFPCMPGFDILCSRKWYEQTLSRFRANFQRVPVEMPREQIPYSGYEEWRKKKDNLMFNDDGSVRSAKEREDIIEKYIAMCPDFWDKPCLGGTQ